MALWYAHSEISSLRERGNTQGRLFLNEVIEIRLEPQPLHILSGILLVTFAKYWQHSLKYDIESLSEQIRTREKIKIGLFSFLAEKKDIHIRFWFIQVTFMLFSFIFEDIH